MLFKWLNFFVHQTHPLPDEFDIDLLDISDGFRGSGKNDLLGARFSTYDRDNDNSNGNCAAESNSGWWFNGKWSIQP